MRLYKGKRNKKKTKEEKRKEMFFIYTYHPPCYNLYNLLSANSLEKDKILQ
jgi:Fe-S oxidoreductase